MRFLVTAGSTQEMIDTVRQWGNIFTGNTGLGIAEGLADLGEVDLLTSNHQHIERLAERQTSTHPIHATAFSSHANLRELLESKMREPGRYDAVFMSAAVSDYRPVRVFAVVARERIPDDPGQERWIVRDVQAEKVKSNHAAIAVLGEQTEKLVDLFRSRWSYRGLLVKFKLEVGITREALIEVGQKSRIASGAEYLVANTLDMVEGPSAGAYLLSGQGSEWIPRGELAGRLTALVRGHF